MKSQGLKKLALPNKSGVYFFLGKNRPSRTRGRRRPASNGASNILYIGRATSLRDRVRSYFGKDLNETRGPKIVKMVEDARSIDHRETDSVLESVLLEADLIRKFKPPYNSDDKDDKSFNCVVITDDDFPRVLIVRKRNLEPKFLSASSKPKALSPKLLAVYGPFPEGGKLIVALKIIRKIFPFRDKCVPYDEQLKKQEGKALARSAFRPFGCFNRQIGLCPGVCTGEISQKEYGKTITNIKRLFEGKKSAIIKSLMQDMKAYAKAQQFEKASQVKRTLFALQHIEDVALLAETPRHSHILENMRIEAYDIAHTSGKETVGVMTLVRGAFPDKIAYRMFTVKSAPAGDDVRALKEILERRFTHPEWGVPDLVVVDGGQAQLNVARDVLSRTGSSTGLVSVVKDERHQPSHFLGDAQYIAKFRRGILLANREAHRFAISFHRRRRDRI